MNANFTCKASGFSGGQYGCLPSAGESASVSFSSGNTNAPGSGYRRELNLNDAVTDLRFSRGDVEFRREMFVSKPDEVMVLRLSANQSQQISFAARLDRPERFVTSGDGEDGLMMTGQLDNGTDGKGVRYVARIRVLNQGGQVSVLWKCFEREPGE